MANYAVIDDTGTVVNVIEYDGVSDYNPGAGLTLVLDTDIRVGRGWIYSNGTFTNPNAGESE